ncbi:MAG TPA: TMEM165/GDT1 family protein [Rudaea sp.]|jgi:putative Ca2+/H+ antiporter (TMEM165/GDT1 family)|nr:TMEM165/GDT1 family protein [Rudaea sp.]
MQTFFISILTVALAELGDKTQLLALILAAKYRRPWPIAAGILAATLINHALAGTIGAVIAKWLAPQTLQWIVAMSLLVIALWTLKPDKADEAEAEHGTNHSVFIATAISFFLAETGDKTQIATAVIAAEYHPLWQVIAGTTTGMLLADVPVIWLGSKFATRLPLRAIRYATALFFATMGIWILLR